jgi:hypothetical protein
VQIGVIGDEQVHSKMRGAGQLNVCVRPNAWMTSLRPRLQE